MFNRFSLIILAWGYHDSNKVGTDESVELNKAIGSQNVLRQRRDRHKEKDVAEEIVSSSGGFAGRASVTEVNSDSIYAPYTYDKRNENVPVPKEIEAKVIKFTYSFPAHSFAQIRVRIE